MLCALLRRTFHWIVPLPKVPRFSFLFFLFFFFQGPGLSDVPDGSGPWCPSPTVQESTGGRWSIHPSYPRLPTYPAQKSPASHHDDLLPAPDPRVLDAAQWMITCISSK
ncbi:hypothetical protein B0T24DRAFT_202841 [Lasiosphaeria ovina]|uniref:Secreted protein n=1 Tax=Lasiosphaeria ovina TaxID=92902 RepID=A0AAE0KGH5_9PEZI|nr:hypothetical protein B0T24DRAFT_202841 [Lasiosphaeria ovina]